MSHNSIEFAWRQCIPLFLDERDLNHATQVSHGMYRHIQPRLARSKWWNFGETGWRNGFRLLFCDFLSDCYKRAELKSLESVSQLTHLKNLPLCVTLPTRLQQLTFSSEFNEPLDGVRLPPGLQQLSFGWCFNQPLDGVRLPAGLQQLSFR